MIKTECKNCHKVFEAPARRKKFCTPLCANLYNGQIRKSNYVAPPKKMRSCKFCGNDFHPLSNKRKYCSHKCAGEGMAGNYVQRFWSKVKKTETCWLWIGGGHPRHGNEGYGAFTCKVFRGRRAHCFSYFLHFGEIPKDMNVLHRCDNPRCVRPDHLFLGTQAENIADMFAKGRDNHARGESAGLAKLTEADVLAIRANYKPRLNSYRALAREFNVNPTTIASVVLGKTWRHVEAT